MAYRSWCRFRRWTIWIGWCCSWTIAGICPIDLLLGSFKGRRECKVSLAVFLREGAGRLSHWFVAWICCLDLLDIVGNREKRDLEVTWCCFGAKSAVPFFGAPKIRKKNLWHTRLELKVFTSRWRDFGTSMGSVVTIQFEVRSFPWCMWNHCFQSWWVDEMVGLLVDDTSYQKA